MAQQGQTAEQIALAAVQAEMAQTRAQLQHVSARFDQLNGSHAALQQAHRALHDEAARLYNERAAEIRALERSIQSLLKRQHCDLLDVQAMKPTVYKGERNEKWKPWARRIK